MHDIGAPTAIEGLEPIRWPDRGVLAVSGGLDSMCLLHLASREPEASRRFVVATFDHRTSEASTRAVQCVVREAGRRGFDVRTGAATKTAASEAAWRAARWSFLRECSRGGQFTICTAHTADDHLETVVMRVLRHAGARGLAGLLVDTPSVARPLLGVTRAELLQFAEREHVDWVEDPTNQSRAYFRNRVRLDLLPALRHAAPTLVPGLLGLSHQAAEWRREFDALSSGWISHADGVPHVAKAILELAPEARGFAWQSVLSQVGVVLDRRGIARLSALTLDGEAGQVTPLSGNVAVERTRAGFVVHRGTGPLDLMEKALEPGQVTSFGSWSFALDATAEVCEAGSSPAVGWLPVGARISVRRWSAGDRLGPAAGRTPRRVARFLADAHVPKTLRKGWPVILADSEIVWIPGLQPAVASPVRPGRPARRLICERSASE